MKVEVTDANRELCLCPGCPTFDGCMRDGGETLYCGVGRTPCEPASKGCLCGGCPVTSAYALKGGYYCLSGEAV